jgi:hypothetical protein
MKNSFFIAAFAAATLVACNNSEKSNSNASDSTIQENAETHGHSHDAEGGHAPSVNQDSIDKAHGHSHEPAKTAQDSIDNAHGHKH